ncbi:hypothetical protein REPUB_Repub08aG0208800 [Reevesia pubescens]
MENFNSEISGSSCSIPSEPPDIRNWISSYKYESFVLDTCENFGGFFSDKSETNKDELVIGEINREKEDHFDGYGELRKSDEHGNLNSKEVQDSLHSPSILSEPPDIRNWFSSYVYESPLLDTDDGFKSYVSREIECEKNQLDIGESIKDEVVNSGQLQEANNSCKNDASENTRSTKLVKCSDSLVDKKNESHPLFSEPPDIGNWFPDYVYESPVLDTSDEFRGTLSMDRESNEDKSAVEDIKRKKQENFKTTKTRCRNEVVVGKKICSNEFGKCNSSLRHDEQEENSNSKDLHWSGGKENLYWQGDVCFEKILDPSLEVKQVRSSSINSNEDVENSGLNGGDSISKHERADSESPDISRSPSKIDRKSSKKMIDRRGSIEKSSETKFQTNQVDLVSHDQSLDFNQVSEGYQRKTTHGNNDKENEGKDIAENGFITTKKNKLRRTNDESSVRIPGEILLQCARNKGSNNTTVGEKDGVIKRKVLAETTNVNVEQCEAKAVGITGKWRCPQKSKPPRGPPLKQLRLEQWIHRV